MRSSSIKNIVLEVGIFAMFGRALGFIGAKKIMATENCITFLLHRVIEDEYCTIRFGVPCYIESKEQAGIIMESILKLNGELKFSDIKDLNGYGFTAHIIERMTESEIESENPKLKCMYIRDLNI